MSGKNTSEDFTGNCGQESEPVKSKNNRGSAVTVSSNKRPGPSTEPTILTRKARIRLNNKGRSYPGPYGRGKSRRNVLKRNVFKAVSSIATIHTRNWLIHEGQYFQIGDIVALEDVEGSHYFAQIRGFLEDQYSTKSCVLTWLIPTQGSPVNRFDPRTFIIGPDEERPRVMDAVTFICHCPSDYYRLADAPYSTVPDYDDMERPTGFVMTKLGYEGCNIPISKDELYGPASLSASDNEDGLGTRDEKQELKDEKDEIGDEDEEKEK